MNGSYRRNSVIARQSGFSMLEVLMAIVVTSVGLLGLASMQATGLKSNHSAYHRSQATVLAYDIADRMRANMGSINNYLTGFRTPTETIPIITPDVNIQSAPTGCKSGVGCSGSSTQMIIDPIIYPGIDPIIDPDIDPVEVDLSGCTSTSGCSSAELAQKDLLEWNSALTTAMPGAVGIITSAGNIYTINIRWDDNRDGAVNATDPLFRVSFQL